MDGNSHPASSMSSMVLPISNESLGFMVLLVMAFLALEGGLWSLPHTSYHGLGAQLVFSSWLGIRSGFGRTKHRWT